MKENEQDAPEETPARTEVVLLEDLSPRKDVKGGSGKRVFGEHADKESS